MVEPHSSSPMRDDTYYHGHYHQATNQSLSAFEYNNSRNVRRGVAPNISNETIQRTSDHVPWIPDGFKSSRAFDTNNLRSENKNTPPPTFIRPKVSSNNSSSHRTTGSTSTRHTSSRPTRNNDVSELFLAEAKAAQAKLDMDMDGDSSLNSYNTYGAVLNRPNALSRQDSSSSSVDAVGPIANDARESSKQFITLQVVDDTVQMSAATYSNARPPQNYSKSVKTHNYTNDADMGHDDDDSYDNRNVHDQHYHYRSHRKPLGLTYALRKTDSGSTFQSLDGLSNSLPLIRHESKNKHRPRSSTKSNKGKRKKRSSASSASSSATFTSTIHTSLINCNPAFDYSNRLACFTAPTCLPINRFKESFNDYRHRYYASTSYQNQSPPESGTISGDNPSDEEDNLNKNSPSKQREGPERPPQSGINVQQQHQVHVIRDRQHESKDIDSPEISTHAVPVVSPSTIVPVKKKPTKQVRFASTLVTKVNYRPYTPQSEIAVLYFQEEELEELECDRETVSGDQFECQFDEMALAVHIAYQKINPSDE